MNYFITFHASQSQKWTSLPNPGLQNLLKLQMLFQHRIRSYSSCYMSVLCFIWYAFIFPMFMLPFKREEKQEKRSIEFKHSGFSFCNTQKAFRKLTMISWSNSNFRSDLLRHRNKTSFILFSSFHLLLWCSHQSVYCGTCSFSSFPP